MTALLSIEGLSLIRGDRCLVRDLSFEVAAGELLLIEGANGSGKTTLLRAMAGLMSIDEGEVTWKGHSVQREPAALRADVAWLAHRVGFKNDLSVAANLRFERTLRGAGRDEQERAVDRLGLRRLLPLPFSRVVSRSAATFGLGPACCSARRHCG